MFSNDAPVAGRVRHYGRQYGRGRRSGHVLIDEGSHRRRPQQRDVAGEQEQRARFSSQKGFRLQECVARPELRLLDCRLNGPVRQVCPQLLGFVTYYDNYRSGRKRLSRS
jgi:hypothetical protein